MRKRADKTELAPYLLFCLLTVQNVDAMAGAPVAILDKEVTLKMGAITYPLQWIDVNFSVKELIIIIIL